MTTMLRHGGEMHTVRPDRVYRTSVLTPIVGYQPQVDVQAVARAFTQGPPLGTQLQGLRGNGVGRVRCWWEGVKSKLGFKNAHPCVALAQDAAGNTVAVDHNGNAAIVSTSPGPASFEASMVAPQMQSQMAMLSRLTAGSNAAIVGPLASGMWSLQNRRPFSYYYAG